MAAAVTPFLPQGLHMIKLKKMNTLRQMTECSVATEKEAKFLTNNGWTLVVEPVKEVKKPIKKLKKILPGDN
jgi:hypothetical protein|tara:strand:- start:1064 stop:1279 length:216 start_codon:yes stop_codon:yes gene_type:complete